MLDRLSGGLFAPPYYHAGISQEFGGLPGIMKLSARDVKTVKCWF